ncbi:TetR family transcriptional regulator [Microbacterium sediminicola]|uniref:TetR family transcriptional regulator n=1 Tax=Microbacterium sediminicola TaxID=415210 RepID=A0ABN2HYH5_9MICO
MRKTSDQPFHVGLTPESVIDAAVGLTRESHLFTWSIRDLAATLGVAPSVIYHHVGGKDLLCRAVTERVFQQILLPPAELEWQEWFRTLLYGIGPLAARYPGTAKWMLMHGPTIPAVLPTVEAGMAVLRRGGFGESTSIAYSLLLNTAMLSIAIGDDRLQHEGDGQRDHATMMREFEQVSSAAPGARELGQRIIGPFVAGGADAQGFRMQHYRLAIDVTIAGLGVIMLGDGAHRSG